MYMCSCMLTWQYSTSLVKSHFNPRLADPAHASQVSLDMMKQSEGAPLLWSAEEPHLYVLVLSVLTSSGDVIEAESTQVVLHNVFVWFHIAVMEIVLHDVDGGLS